MLTAPLAAMTRKLGGTAALY